MIEDIGTYMAIFLICLTFASTAVYFIALYKFNKYIQKQYPQLWLSAKEAGRKFESKFATAYRVFKNLKSLPMKGIILDEQGIRLARHVKLTQYFALTCFMIILIGGLYMSVNK